MDRPTDFIYELQPGEEWTPLGAREILVIHPDRAPKIVSALGTASADLNQPLTLLAAAERVRAAGYELPGAANPDPRAYARMMAGVIGAQRELERQSSEGDFYFRVEDSMVDGRIDLGALVRAVLAHADRVNAG